jgi:hypothetical protein
MNHTGPAAGQIWRPTKAGTKAKERLVVRVCPDRLGNPGVDYAEAGGDRSWITLSAWNAWVRGHAAQMEEPRFAGSAERLAKLTRRGSRG